MRHRHRGRILALQFLYSLELNPDSKEQLPLYMLEFNQQKKDGAYFFALLLYNGVIENQISIDEKIQKFLKGWTIDRIARLDLIIIRLAAYELLFQKETPISVVINEAILLAKSFSAPESYKFINGILESFIQDPLKKEIEKEVRP